MHIAQEILYLVLGFIFLAKGSDWLVTGGSTLADRLGVRPLVVGLTVVAWGTSAPELVVSGKAAFGPDPEMAMGNVLGSNVANIGLVLGVSAIILPKVLEGALALRESFWLLGSVAIFWLLCRDLELSRTDGAILLGALSIYNLQLLWEARQRSVGVEADVLEPGASWLERSPVLATIMGGVTIALAATLTLEGAEGLAHRFEIDPVVVGLSILAVGTSLPELAAGVTSALKGHSDISVGNVVGSNVFNVLGVIGVVAIIHPLGGAADPVVQESLRTSVERDFPVVMVFSIVALILPAIGGEKAGRLKGFLMLTAYLGYMAFLFSSGAVEELPAP